MCAAIGSGIVAVAAVTFLIAGNATVYLSTAKERVQFAGSKNAIITQTDMGPLRQNSYRFPIRTTLALLLAATLAGVMPMHAQLINEPPIPAKQKKQKPRPADLEWMWQYSPPPADGRENELIQDPHFRPFLERYLIAPQAFWGPNPTDPKSPIHKSLADTANDFLVIPGRVIADENRYITFNGAVRHFRTSRGLVFADLNTAQPLVVFAAIDWIRDSNAIDDPNAQYTLWIFPNQPTGSPANPQYLPPPLVRSLTRWMAEPIAGTGIVQKITAAVIVDADGTPHQIPVPVADKATPTSDAPALPKRH